MDSKFERKLDINEWIITTRWFYMVAVFLIGIFGNSLIGLFSKDFSFFSILILLLVFLSINAYFYKVLIEIKKVQSEKRLKMLGVSQIGLEIIIFSLILRLVGDASIAGVFFYLPIISASILFGVKEAVITALISIFIVNASVVYEYFNVVSTYITGSGQITELGWFSLRQATISIIQTIVTSNFYLVIAIFSGYTAKLQAEREQNLIMQKEELQISNKMSENEKARLNKTAKTLAARDSELMKMNEKLNSKIKALENSEKSMMRAFSDLQAERKRTTEEQNKIASIISNFVDPIIVMDKEGKINLLNPSAREIFGFIEDDLGKTVDSSNNYSMENFKKIIKQDFSVKNHKDLKTDDINVEEVVVKLSNQELTFKVTTEQVIDNRDNYLGTMKIFYNLTREKMIDNLKSEFISIAAHQLRTPLSAIKWVIKMILDGDVGKLNEEQQGLLFKGYQSNERIINLVNDMLNVSRIEEGRFGYNFENTSFLDLVDSQVSILEPLFKRKNISFVINKPKKVPSVYIDGEKMRLAIQNLLENAVKYTPEFGKIELTVVVSDNFLKVKLKDNGVGIPKDCQDKLFSKFFRADNVIRLQTEGSGLGLFIVKNIIKKHGGEITFKSEEGMGTEFVFTIPLNKTR